VHKHHHGLIGIHKYGYTKINQRIQKIIVYELKTRVPID